MRAGTRTAFFTGFLLATPLAAQDVSGTITGTLGLEPASWYVSTLDDTGGSGWDRTDNAVDVRLVGLVSREAASLSQGALTIDIQTEGNPTEMDVTDFTIRLLSDGAVGEAGETYSASAANADLDLETLEISGNSMVLAGSFSGRLIEGGAEELVLDSSVPSVTVDGNFQATLARRDAE